MLMAKLRSSVHSRAQASPSLAATQKELKAGTHKGPKPSAAVVGLSSQRPLTHLAEPQDHPIIHEFSGVQRGALHKRYKRFLGDVSFAGKAGNELEGGANPPLTGGSTTSEVTVSLGSTAGHALEGGANPPLAEDSSAASCSSSLQYIYLKDSQVSPYFGADSANNWGRMGRQAHQITRVTRVTRDLIMITRPQGARHLVTRVTRVTRDLIMITRPQGARHLVTRVTRVTRDLIMITRPQGARHLVTRVTRVGVHSALANKIVRKLLEDGHLEGILGSYTVLQSEVAVGQASPNPSRLDFMLTRKNGKRMYIEVKSATLSEPMKGESPETNIALFPDTVSALALKRMTEIANMVKDESTTVQYSTCLQVSTQALKHMTEIANMGSKRAQRHMTKIVNLVSTRALKHMKEIANLVKDGHEAACVFLIQRGDCTHFAPCHEKDPVYAAAVQEETDGTAVARYLGPAEVLLGYQAQDWVADC
eukprot:gene4602-14794_t